MSSTAVGFVSRKRPFSTEAQIGLADTAVEKDIFRLNFFRLSFPAGASSRKGQVLRLDAIYQSKNSVEKALHVSF